MLRHVWLVVIAAAALCFGQQQVSLSGFVTPSAPAQEPVSLVAQRIVVGDTVVEAGLTFLMSSHNVHVYRDGTLFFGITNNTARGVGPLRISMPPPVRYRNLDGTMADVISQGQVIRITRPIVADDWNFVITLQYQACDSTKCFPPRRRSFRFSSDGADSAWDPGSVFPSAGGGDRLSLDGFTIAGSAAGYLNAATFSQFLDDPAAYGSSQSLAGKSLWLIVALVLLGGLALNFTPCVLPVIPITLAVIGAGAQAGSRMRGFLVGGVYGLGMALAYGILGVIVATTGAQFGLINSSPTFNLMIAVVFAILALAMFDVVHIDFTRFRSGIRHNEKRRGNLIAAFAMGVVAAVLAGACVAPVLISVILYSSSLYADGRIVGLALPFLLGAGMALPWPLAGAGMSVLPKPGKWMTWVKYVFGAVILVMAAYYGYEGVKLVARSRVPAQVMGTTEATGTWIRSLEKGLAASRNEGKPVLIDFWASWCKNCLAMDATTFTDPRVKARLKNFVCVKYQADDPGNADTKAMLDRFGVVGLPTYVVLRPGE